MDKASYRRKDLFGLMATESFTIVVGSGAAGRHCTWSCRPRAHTWNREQEAERTNTE